MGVSLPYFLKLSMNAEILSRGKSKKDEPGFQFQRLRCGSGIDWVKAGQGRGFDFRSSTQEGIPGREEAGKGKEALTVDPICQQPVKQPGEVAFPRLRLLDISGGQSDQDGLFSLGRSASAFALTSSSLFLH